MFKLFAKKATDNLHVELSGDKFDTLVSILESHGVVVVEPASLRQQLHDRASYYRSGEGPEMSYPEKWYGYRIFSKLDSSQKNVASVQFGRYGRAGNWTDEKVAAINEALNAVFGR